MKIRLMCLPDEAPAAVQALERVFDVIEVSDPYPCRNSRNVRVYVEARLVDGTADPELPRA